MTIARLAFWSITFTVVAVLVVACPHKPSKYESIFDRPSREWGKLMVEYPLEEQVDIYLEAVRRMYPPPAALAIPLADNGPEIIPILRSRLRASEDDFDTLRLLAVFNIIQTRGIYRVAGDEELMNELRWTADTAGVGSRRYARQSVEDIINRDRNWRPRDQR